LGKKQILACALFEKAMVSDKTSPLRMIVTGAAGTGKSVVIKVISITAALHFDGVWNPQEAKSLVVLAHTGSAASNVQGETIDSIFPAKISAERAHERYCMIQVLVIDEYSMLDPCRLRRIDLNLKLGKGNSEPFGGVHVILAGDFYQLGAIKCKLQFFSQQIQNPSSDYERMSNEGLQLYQDFFHSYIELTKNYRQISDTTGFAGALLRARKNWKGCSEHEVEADIRLFNTRFHHNLETVLDNVPEDVVFLATTKARIAEMNEVFSKRLRSKGETQVNIYAQHYPHGANALRSCSPQPTSTHDQTNGLMSGSDTDEDDAFVGADERQIFEDAALQWAMSDTHADDDSRSADHDEDFTTDADLWAMSSGEPEQRSRRNIRGLFSTVDDSGLNACKRLQLLSVPTDRLKLSPLLTLSTGMRVIINNNFGPRIGIYNGTSGTVAGFVYNSSLPICSNITDAKVAALHNAQVPVALIRIDRRHWQAFQSADASISRPNLPVFPGIESNDRIIPVGAISQDFVHNKTKYTRVQLPIIPAAAMTVHRAQGITRECVIVDASDNFSFARALMYVALSRVQSISGLFIIGSKLTRHHFEVKMASEGVQIEEEYERLRTFEGNSIRMALQHIRLQFPDFDYDPAIGDV
jgi:hypothetical protein